MGAHEKQEDCNACNAKGGWWTTKDGKDGGKVWINCATCKGTGKVP